MTRASLAPMRAIPVLIAVIFNVILGPLALPGTVAAADGIDDYSQCQIGNPSSGLDCESWINGILNATHNNYSEDEVVPQRLVIDFDDTDAHSVTLSYMTRKDSGTQNHAYDYLATWNHTYVNADRCQSLGNPALCVGGLPDLHPIPSDPNPVTPGGPQPTSAHELPQASRLFVMYGGDIIDTSPITHSTDPAEAGSDYGNITINFDVTDSNGRVMLLFGGHLAAGFGPRGWGAGLGAASISGGPYHIRVTALDGASAGNRDNQIMSNAITPLPGLEIEKSTSTPVISAGDVASYTVTVTNGGQGDATGVVITDALPSGVAWTESPDHPSCTISGGVSLSCGPLTIAAGTAFSVTVHGTTDAGECPGISNTASFSSTNGGSGSTASTPTVITVNCPTIRIEKTPDEDAQNPAANDVTAGGAATFTITAYNDGAGTASGVSVTDDLPGTGWSVVGAATTLTNCVVNNPGGDETLSCGPDSIGAGLSRQVTVTRTTVHPADCGEMNNTANVTTGNDGADSDGGNIDVLCAEIRVEKTPDEATDTTANDIAAGEAATFTIVVHNDGNGEAEDVTLFDNVPEVDNGWTVVAGETTLTGCAITNPTEGPFAAMGEILTCGPDTIPAGGSAQVTITTETTTADCRSLNNTATAAAGNDGTDSDAANIDVLCPSLVIEKTPDGEVINAGDEISFMITVTNNGAGTALGVTLDDELPAGFAWAEDPELAECAITLGDLHCDVGDLGPTESFSVTVSAQTAFADCAENAYVNTAVANASNHAQIDDTGDVLIECPDLEVTKSPDGEVFNAGDEISFEIVVTNHGPGIAHDVTLDDELPAGFAWAEDPDNAACAITDGTLHCDIGDLGDDASFSVTVSAPTTSANCAENAYVNTAVAGAANHADVDDTGDVQIDCPDLTVDKEQVDANGDATDEPVDAGETASFAFTVTNLGPGVARDVVVTDTAPAGTTWTIVDDGGLDCESASEGDQQTITCSTDELGDGESATVLLSYETSVDDCGLLDNAVVVQGSNEPAANTENNADEASIVVECPGLNIVKQQVDANGDPTDDPIVAGDTAYFVVIVWNAGPGDAFDVVVEDDLPDGVSWTIDAPDAIDCASSVSTEDGQSFSCDLGDLAPSGMAGGVVISVFGVTDRADCGQLTNVAMVDGSNNRDEVQPATATITVTCPTLVIDKTANVDVITISGPANAQVATPSVVTWTLTYTLTDGPVTNAVITDEIPAGLDYVGGSASHGGTFADGVLTWTFPMLAESGSVTFQTAVDVETISRSEPTVNVAVIGSDQTPEDEGRDAVRVVVEPPVLGGTPRPRPSVPDTALAIGPSGRPVTVPIELVAVLFLGSLGTLAFANLRAVRQRRR